MAVFRQKVHLSRRKSATKFLYVKIVIDKVVISAKIVAGERLLLPKNWLKETHPFSKTPISNQYSMDLYCPIRSLCDS